MKYVITFLILIMLVVPSVMAQDESPCQGNLAVMYGGMSEDLELLEASAANENVEMFLDTLWKVRIQIAIIDSFCRGYSFNSEDDGLQPVIGPVYFLNDGIYRVTYTSTGFGSIEVETIEGTCETDMFGSLFLMMEGQANDGAQTTFTTQGCAALIKVGNTTAPWTLEFELIVPKQDG